MIIHNDFYLKGFTRLDKGEAGAVFVHYDEERAENALKAPEIKETPIMYGGANTVNYTLALPRPMPRKVTA